MPANVSCRALLITLVRRKNADSPPCPRPDFNSYRNFPYYRVNVARPVKVRLPTTLPWGGTATLCVSTYAPVPESPVIVMFAVAVWRRTSRPSRLGPQTM